MKKFILVLALALSFSASAKIKVFTTTTNLADVVRQVGGTEVSVSSLCKGTQDPHYLEAKPSYTFKLSKADLLVSIGAGLEVGWLPLVIRGSRNPDLREGQKGHLVASHAVRLLEVDDTKISRSLGDVHPEGNPHFMLSPTKSVDVAKAIAERLSNLKPEKKNYFQSRYRKYEKKIKEKFSRWKSMIGKNKKVITYHKTLTYFYDDFKIKNVDVLEPKPGIPPSASHVLKIISKVKSEKVKKIIVENYFDYTVAKRIQKDIPSLGVEVVPVAVEGKDGINDLFDLYNYLAKRIGG